MAAEDHYSSTTDTSQDPLLPPGEDHEEHNLAGTGSHGRRYSITEYFEGATTKVEVLGWCLYSWAIEPFIVSAVSTYVPLLLEQFARDNGVLQDDHSKNCKAEPINPVPPSGLSTNVSSIARRQVLSALTSLVERALDEETAAAADKKIQCVVNVFGKYIDPASFTLYVFSLSVFLQTLVVISITGFADKGNYKKTLLIAFGFVGSLITMDFYLLDTENYYRAGLYCILANICFGVVNVCGNSFLPILVENYEIENKRSLTVSELVKEKGIISSKISGLCSGLGYFAALIVQLFTMVIVVKTGSTIASIQYAILFVGVWWFVFQFPVIWLLKSRKVNSPISLSDNFRKSHWHLSNPVIRKAYFFKEYVKIGWKNLFLAFQQIKLLKDVCIFIVGWFVISDSVTTINSAAILFSKTELHMETQELAVIGVLTIIFAIAGTVIIPNYFTKHLQFSLKKTLLLIIVWSSFIPFYGILGFYFERFGLKHKSEMYFLASWYGLSLGGLATIARSLFGLLIPKGKESLFFALYAVTDKGSSIFGPFIVGLITDKTHNIRYCFWFLWALLVISLPIFNMLDTERGQDEAARFDELVLEAERAAEDS